MTATIREATEKAKLVRTAESLDRGAAGAELDGLIEAETELGRTIAAFLLRKAGRDDRYQDRADPVYLRTYAVQRTLFGERAYRQKIDLLKDMLARRRGRVTLLVLGIEGDVLTRALQALHAEGGDCSRITVAIVDPLAEEVEREAKRLRALRAAPGAVLAFARSAEGLTEAEWEQIRGTSGEFVVYALLSLHFICEPGQRDDLFRRLHALGRVTVALLEHDLDLLRTRSLAERVDLVWHYYLPQFALVAGLACTAEERSVLLDRLGLMVRDCLSDARDVLCLRYTESHAGWSARLLAAGFSHDPNPRRGDLGRLPGAGITVASWDDRSRRFYLCSTNYDARNQE